MSNKRASQPSGFGQNVKKFFLSAFVVLSFIAYLLHQRRPAVASTGAPTAGPNANGVTNLPVTSQGGGSATTVPTALIPAQGVTYKNGTYQGPAVDVFYGQVQVQVVISNGRISDVQFLQYPSDRRTSQEINSQAMPWLTQEAIQAQSANVDLISGATLTSEGFVNSLQAALQSAKN